MDLRITGSSSKPVALRIPISRPMRSISNRMVRVLFRLGIFTTQNFIPLMVRNSHRDTSRLNSMGKEIRFLTACFGITLELYHPFGIFVSMNFCRGTFTQHGENQLKVIHMIAEIFPSGASNFNCRQNVDSSTPSNTRPARFKLATFGFNFQKN